MKYIIATCQYNAMVNKNLLQNIELFAKEHGVDNLLLFVQNGQYKEDDIIDKRLFEAGFSIVEDMKLNANLYLKDMRILAQQINPFTGMNQKLNRDYSYILPSAKIRYQSLANTSKYPRALMSTGSITKPNYKMHTAQGEKAYQQHQYGFVYVSTECNTIFHAHQIEATKQGDFQYMTEKYHNGVLSYAQPEALILGDYHTGDTCPKVRKRTIQMIKELKPKRVVFHDLFNGHSVNHHEKGDLIQELKSVQLKRSDLKTELEMVYKEIMFFATTFPETTFIVSESNHDIFLERYIRSKDFMYNPSNFLFVCSMIPKIIVGEQPTLRIALEQIGTIPDNFKFLKEDESYRIRGVEIGVHGHRGPNGSRGGNFDKYNLKMISGHTHSPFLGQNSMVVGTSTKLKLDYTKGPSSWLNAHGILYSNGKYALITLIV